MTFRPWHLATEGASVERIRNLLGDNAGGLWVLGATGIVHLKDGVVTSHFALEGLMPNPNNVSEDTDGQLWVVRGENGDSNHFAMLLSVAIQVFRKSGWDTDQPNRRDSGRREGRILVGRADGPGPLAFRGSEIYPVKALKSNMGDQG